MVRVWPPWVRGRAREGRKTCGWGQRQLNQSDFPGLSLFLNSSPLLSNPLANFVPYVSKLYLELAPASHPLQGPSLYHRLAQLQRLLSALLAPQPSIHRAARATFTNTNKTHCSWHHGRIMIQPVLVCSHQLLSGLQWD